MRIDAIPIGKNPPHDVNVLIEVPIGGEPIKYEMDKAAGGNVMICVENTAFGGFRHLPDALDLLLLSPAFALTYDCGHDHADGGRAKGFYAARG